MNEYQKLVMYLKIMMCNLAILHHNVVGDGWFEAHSEIEAWTDHLHAVTDDIIETGIALGYDEPTIAASVLAFQSDVLAAEKRGKNASYAIIRDAMRTASGLMQAAEAIVPVSVQNKLQEVEYWLNKEANYKLNAALIGGRTGKEYEDD